MAPTVHTRCLCQLCCLCHFWVCFCWLVSLLAFLDFSVSGSFLLHARHCDFTALSAGYFCILKHSLFFFFLSVYFWLSWVFAAVCGLPLVVPRFLVAVASSVAEHGLGPVGSAAVAYSPSSPRPAQSSAPGIEPPFPALARGSLTAGPLRKPLTIFWALYWSTVKLLGNNLILLNFV